MAKDAGHLRETDFVKPAHINDGALIALVTSLQFLITPQAGHQWTSIGPPAATLMVCQWHL